jgi:transposase
VAHKRAREAHLVDQGRHLFAFTNELLFYDLTSTYCEGRMAGNPKAQRGYSRDHRPDCKHLCLGLVVNREGFPLGFEALPGNSRDAATLTPLITALEARCGGTRRVMGFDRGMATEAHRRHWRQSQRPYLCAVRRAVTRQYLPAIRQGPWQTVRTGNGDEPANAVQALPDQEQDGVRERWLLCRSAGCHLKERHMFEARVQRARSRLARLAAQGAAGTFTRAAVIHRKAKQAVGRTHDVRGIFSWELRRAGGHRALRIEDNATAIQDEHDLQGVYLLRTTEAPLVPVDWWHTYMLLTSVEAAFRNLKTDLCLRPIFHHKEARADAHVLFAVLAYALSVTIQWRHRRQQGTQTTAALLETLESVQLAELSFRTTQGERLRLERASIPTAAQQGILDSLGWPIPERYLPPDLNTEPARL